MKTLDSFLADGEVRCAKIARAVASGELTRDEIHELCKDSRMKAAFIGTSYSKKCSKDRWNKEYLDELLCAVAAASFNEDYLLYLYEVAESVRNKEKSRLFVLLARVIGWLLIAALAVIAIVMNVQK